MIEVYETPEEIETAAEAAGISMRVVCAKAGLAHTTWYRWRNAATKPTHEVRVRLTQALHTLKSEAA